jgi:hypothetical protein
VEPKELKTKRLRLEPGAGARLRSPRTLLRAGAKLTKETGAKRLELRLRLRLRSKRTGTKTKNGD